MGDREDLLRELHQQREAARAAGDSQLFEEIDADYKQVMQIVVADQKLKSPNENYISGVVNSAGRGVSAGYLGKALSAVDPVSGDLRREGLRQFDDDYPWSSGGADMGGSFVGPAKIFGKVPWFRAKKGASTWQRAGQLAKEGGTIGALEGSGRSDADTLAGLATDTAVNAGFGALGGPIFGALMHGGKAVKDWVTTKWRNMGKDDVDKAVELIQAQLDESGLSPDDVAQVLDDLGPEATLLDVNNAMRGLGIAVAQKSSAALETIVPKIKERQAGAGKRVTQALDEASTKPNNLPPTQQPGTNFYTEPRKLRAGLEDSKVAKGKILYPLAESQSVPRGKIADILDNDLIKPLLTQVRNTQDGGLPKAIDWDADVISVAHINDLKKMLDGYAKRSPTGSPADNTRAGYYGTLVKKLVAITDELVPEFSAARRAWEKSSRLTDKVGKTGADDLGADIARVKGQVLDEVEDKVAVMTPDEAFVFRNSGAGRLAEHATREGTAGGRTANKVGRLIGEETSDRSRRLDLVSSTGEARRKLQGKLDAEAEFHDTYRMANPNIGAKTAFNQMSSKRNDEAQSRLIDGIGTLATGGDPTALAVRGVIGMLKDNGISPNVASEIAKMLVNPRTTMEMITRSLAKTTLPAAEKNKIIRAWETLRNTLDLPSVGEGLTTFGLGQTQEHLLNEY